MRRRAPASRGASAQDHRTTYYHPETIMTKKITTARITALPKRLGDPMPIIHITLEGEDEERELLELFTYYPDEISFTPEDFIGLTIEQAERLKFNRDQGILVRNAEPP
jgi:hypothetical protein